MTEPKIDLEEPYHAMLMSLRPVVEEIIEEIIEEELDLNAYVGTVIWRGLRAMLEDIIPRDPEVLMKSILLMHEGNPEFVASFINDMLRAGAVQEEVKHRLGFIKEE